MRVDPRAASGFAGSADAYERGRPSYPAGAIADVAWRLEVDALSTVVDLAAGTGKLTAVLEPLVGRLIAIDPSASMLAALRRRLPSVETREGAAEAIPADDGTIDAVFMAQAFHWFGATDACREITRVLSPRGGLAVLWNRCCWHDAEHAWLEAFEALVGPYRAAAGPLPSGDGRWRRALEESRRFGPLSSAEVRHVHRVIREDFIAQVASWSWIANVPGPERAALLERIRELVGDQPVLDLPYRTEIHWTRRARG